MCCAWKGDGSVDVLFLAPAVGSRPLAQSAKWQSHAKPQTLAHEADAHPAGPPASRMQAK